MQKYIQRKKVDVIEKITHKTRIEQAVSSGIQGVI